MRLFPRSFNQSNLNNHSFGSVCLQLQLRSTFLQPARLKSTLAFIDWLQNNISAEADGLVFQCLFSTLREFLGLDVDELGSDSTGVYLIVLSGRIDIVFGRSSLLWLEIFLWRHLILVIGSDLPYKLMFSFSEHYVRISLFVVCRWWVTVERTNKWLEFQALCVRCRGIRFTCARRSWEGIRFTCARRSWEGLRWASGVAGDAEESHSQWWLGLFWVFHWRSTSSDSFCWVSGTSPFCSVALYQLPFSPVGRKLRVSA